MYIREKVGIVVKQRGYEDIESLIRRFKKKVSKSGIIKEVRNKMYFEKPSDIKRRKKILAIKARKREDEKRRLIELGRKPVKPKKKKKRGEHNETRSD